MRKRWPSLVLALGLHAVYCLPAFGGAVPLFIIQRSKNANVVHYDANLDAGGKFDRAEPVTAYWILLAKDGSRHELNWLERTKAYGFDLKPDGPDCYLMTLAAYDARQIRVCPEGDAVKARLTISGRNAVLEKLYINSSETFGLPKVHWVELFGHDPQSGEKVSERILP